MIVLKFERYGTLWQYNGVPVRINGRLVTRNKMAWWWPINWIALIVLGPVVLYRIARGKLP